MLKFGSNMIDPMSLSGEVADPIGGIQGAMPIPMATGGPQAATGGGMVDPATLMAQAGMAGPTGPGMGDFDIPEPTFSQKLVNAGLAMIAADQSGLGLGGAMGAGFNAFNQTDERSREERRRMRRERLAEYELLGRIRERQLAEQQAARRLTMLEKLKETNPKLADLIELDPDMAAKVVAEGMLPKERKIVEQGGVQYYADTGEPVLPNAPLKSTPFEGTGMEAQVANILLTGNPATQEYLAAYNIARQPRVVVGPDGTPVTINPDMSAYRLPGSGAMPAVGSTTGAMGPSGGIVFGTPEMAQVEGYDLAPGARPSSTDAKAVKEILEAEKNISILMDEREKLIKDNKTPLAGSAEAIKIDQNTNQLALKIKALEQTGALDQGSVDVIMSAIGDPVIRGTQFSNPIKSTRESLTKKYQGKTLVPQMTESGRNYIKNTLESAVTARGYRKRAQGGSANTGNTDLKAKYGLE